MGVQIEDIINEFYELTEDEKDRCISIVLDKFKSEGCSVYSFNDNLDFFQIYYLLPSDEAINMDDEITNTLDNIIVKEQIPDVRLITDIKKYPGIPISVLTINLSYKPDFFKEAQNLISIIGAISEDYDVLRVGYKNKWLKPDSSKYKKGLKYIQN